jgi:DHA2 family multidrug resistance protein
MITFSVMGASIMQSLDTTIATIALPHMQGSLSGTQDQMIWVLTSYIVATAIMTPLSGWLAVRIGRKRVFSYSIVGFTIASALCGAAESLPQIVVFRALQGICGAALIPLSQAILLDINPKERHGRAMGIWGMGVVLGPIIGPLLGGWLTEDYSWRWVFYVNVPFGILAWLGIAAYLPETAKRRSQFDSFGFASLALGIGALQLMLDRGALKDWFSSTEIRIEALIAVLALYFFVVHTWASQRPFINRQLFHDRNFLVGNIFIFMFGVVLFATMALLPPLLQGLLGYPVLIAGLVTAPRGIGTWVAMALVGRLTSRIDARWIIAVGLSLSVLALWQMASFSPQMGQRPIVISGLTQGFGMGLSWVALSLVSFATIPAALRNEAASMFNLVRNIGSSAGISSIQAYVTSGTQIANAQLVQHIDPYGMQVHQPDLAAQLSGVEGASALSAQIWSQAGWIAYLDAFRLMMYLTILVLPLLFFVRRVKADRAAQQVVVE